MQIENWNTDNGYTPVQRITYDDGTIVHYIDGELTSVTPAFAPMPLAYARVPMALINDGGRFDFDKYVAETCVALCPMIVWEAPTLDALSKVLGTMHPDDINGGRVRLEYRTGDRDWSRCYVDEYEHTLEPFNRSDEPLTAWFASDSYCSIFRMYRGSVESTYEKISEDPPSELCISADDYDADDYADDYDRPYPCDNGLFSSEFADAMQFDADEIKFRVVIEVSK